MSLPKLLHQIVFVSKQTVPLILGAFLQGNSPLHLHAIVTDDMREAAKAIQKTFERRKRALNFHSYHLARIDYQPAILDLLDKIYEQCAGQDLGLNLTGGTKLMALAAFGWASSRGLPTFYIDTQNEQLIMLGQSWLTEPLPAVLTVHDLLCAYGFAIDSFAADPVPPERRELLQRVLECILLKPLGEEALARLNKLGTVAKNANILLVNDPEPSFPAFDELLELLSGALMLERGAQSLKFASKDALAWCNGLWFEEYVKMVLYRLKVSKSISSFATSVQVQKAGVRNELDAIFSSRNRLFTIECKTTHMSPQKSPDLVSQMLYKSDSLNDRLGGIFARSMLCSVRPILPKDLNRAHNHTIKILSGQDLLQLEQNILDWSQKA